MLRVAAGLFLAHSFLWILLFLRWMTFGVFDWQPFGLEMTLAQWPPSLAYALYGVLAVVDAVIGFGLLRGRRWALSGGFVRAALLFVAGLVYYAATRQFYEAMLIVSLSGMLLVLLSRKLTYTLVYPAGFWLAVFFVAPLLIVFVVSLGERSRLGTVSYPQLSLDGLGLLFNDYARFFGRINGEFIYLRIFARSVWLAVLNTAICLVFGYPFAYWIARQPQRHRNLLIFLVMIPFWTNFLVRTYAWILILRDSGIINNFWTITLHQQAVLLAQRSALFSWLAHATTEKLPLLFNQPAVLLGLFYGYLPFMILPLYANLERMDWSLLEAAADLGAGRRHTTTRILLPLSLPGIAAGSIIVFIPSLGAYVTPDLMGGARVSLVGNLLQQQFMTVRDWPFGSAIGFILMAIMLIATIMYFRLTAGSGERIA
ncbi:MAG TPA: ABC transporter permease [Candidatus Binatia bacterium]|jgi:spermidine/putrescine transport system permease protein|nr:ABC transporter permease [Candidatus Binatia bacterium]